MRSLAEKYYDEGQCTNVINYLKEVIRLEYPLKYSEQRLISTNFWLIQRPFFDILNDVKNNVIKHKSDKLSIYLISNAKEALFNLCNNAICLLNDKSVEKDISEEFIAHYMCFKAINYYKLVYYSLNICNEDGKNKALELYEEATEITNKYLNRAHPATLYITYHFSLLYRLFIDDKTKALNKKSIAYFYSYFKTSNMLNFKL